ncbi:MAG: hypothetical protein LDL33_06195 [Desulfomonile sp.]|nr:hypothetical protein [Desulfomonile sp.]
MAYKPFQLLAFCLLALIAAGCTGTQLQRKPVERPPVITEEDLKSDTSVESQAGPAPTQSPTPPAAPPQPLPSGSGEYQAPPSMSGGIESRPPTDPSQRPPAIYRKGKTGWERVNPDR